MTTHDTNGREYAKLADLKVGDMIEIDAGFTCAPAGIHEVRAISDGLYFKCDETYHLLEGQLDPDGYLVGIYQTPKHP